MLCKGFSCYFIQVIFQQYLHIVYVFYIYLHKNYYLKYVANVTSYPKWTVLVSYFWCNNELLFVQIDSRYSILRTYFAWCIFKRFRKSLHCITYCNKENLLFYQPLFCKWEAFASFWFSFLLISFKIFRNAC